MAKEPDQSHKHGVLKITLQRCLFLIPVILGFLWHKSSQQSSRPQATTTNGTYSGYTNTHYSTDHFLGIPYAQPPLGPLRLKLPQSLEQTWTGLREATNYYPSCVGYGEDSVLALSNHVSEDCLALNVIRPAGTTAQDKLPVLVWIHGGGWVGGGSADGRYNLTFIVEQSAIMGKPIIGVSINYRVSGWGFLWSKEIVQEGVANLGLRDQRLALQWIRENIRGFGGDTERVTLWGESGGSHSVARHMLAFNGRDDALFSGAISVSGTPFGFGTLNTNPIAAQKHYDLIVARVGCSTEANTLECLRTVPFSVLNDVLDQDLMGEHGKLVYYPICDGDFVARDPVDQFLTGGFVRVPYLLGDCSDEGTSVADYTAPINSDDEFRHEFAKLGFPRDVIEELMVRYPRDAPWLIPETYPGQFGPEIGSQWKRAATILGDSTFIASRRLTLNSWVNQTKVPIYHFRFHVIPGGVSEQYSAVHFVDVPFTFHNVEGNGYTGVAPPYLGGNPFEGKPQSYYDLAELVSRMWISFTNDGTPNYARQIGPTWPPYNARNRAQYVFSAEDPPHVTVDDKRVEGIEYMIEHMRKRAKPFDM